MNKTQREKANDQAFKNQLARYGFAKFLSLDENKKRHKLKQLKWARSNRLRMVIDLVDQIEKNTLPPFSPSDRIEQKKRFEVVKKMLVDILHLGVKDVS